jgi:glyoxylase-like metal-dependent hydrolase (beta-lactamase superfamily II)
MLVFVGMLLAALAGGAQAQTEAKRGITRIAGDLYRFQNNYHYSVFLVTPAGIIATDPIDAAAAQWLKRELASRFDKPVKYLIYSHDHRDHIAGGEVFADTAIVVAHENAKKDIIEEKRPTAVPELTFSDTLTIELGGRSVELSYLGRSHSDNMIVMRFPAERVLFAVDFIPIKTVAWKDLSDAYIPDWMAAIARVEAMDFDILAPGHGPLGTRADATAFRGYMETLHRQVTAAHRAGQSLAQMQSSITMPEYKDWGAYDRHFKLNIEGMYNHVSLQRRGN